MGQNKLKSSRHEYDPAYREEEAISEAAMLTCRRTGISGCRVVTREQDFRRMCNCSGDGCQGRPKAWEGGTVMSAA